MVFNESDELFTIRQQFFSGEYSEVSEVSIEEFSSEIQDVVKEYKLRSLNNLGLHDEVLLILENEDDSLLNRVIKLYTLSLKNEDVSKEFQEIIEHDHKEWFVQILGSLYLVRLGSVDEAIKLLQYNEDSLESVLILIELLLHQNKLDQAKLELSKASSYSNDSIIFNLAESYINSVSNGDSLRGALYFFEELSHNHPTVKTLNGQLVLNLQLHQFPEAEVVFKQLDDIKDGSKEDVIANEITYANIIGDLNKATEKRNELTKLNPNHPFIVDYEAKNQLFDSVVLKYTS